MDNGELTEYIKHYLEKDKTRSAIMLTGGWGTGKSYYIQNELTPALQREKANECITISLYGLRSVSEISKSIYLELRAKFLQSRNETTATGRLIAKTIVKGLINRFGINLSTSQDEMQKLYESIDLSGKLIILEDVERSQIDILELFGYVNNLVERDGVKLLLVVNEDEITKSISVKENPENNKDSALPANTTKQYLAIKEKTVSDTIPFEGNCYAAVQQIIRSYNNPILSRFADKSSAENICNIMSLCKNHNLRSFIFACQKSVDIFEQMEEKYTKDTSFVQCIFFGIISFSLRLKAGKNTEWGYKDYIKKYSIDLGTEKFPLFDFCFDYITYHKLDTSKIPAAMAALKKRRLYDKDKTQYDRDLQTLFNYQQHYESDVKKTVINITERLKDPEDISFYDYAKLAVYLVKIKYFLEKDIDIETAKSLLIENLNGREDDLVPEELFFPSYDILSEDEDPNVKHECEEIQQKMESALKKNTQAILRFKYLPEEAGQSFNNIIENRKAIFRNGYFAKELDIPELARMFSDCSPVQKYHIRNIFLAIYGSENDNIKVFSKNDAPSVEKLLRLIKADMQKPMEDRIQKLQYKLFSENLTEILKRFS